MIELCQDSNEQTMAWSFYLLCRLLNWVRSIRGPTLKMEFHYLRFSTLTTVVLLSSGWLVLPVLAETHMSYSYKTSLALEMASTLNYLAMKSSISCQKGHYILRAVSCWQLSNEADHRVVVVTAEQIWSRLCAIYWACVLGERPQGVRLCKLMCVPVNRSLARSRRVAFFLNSLKLIRGSTCLKWLIRVWVET